MKKLAIILLMAWSAVQVFSQKFISDHEIAKEEVLRSIPNKYIQKARNELKVSYQHTSHGTQVYQGLSGLLYYKPGDDTLFAMYPNPKPDRLLFRDNFMYKIAPEGVEAVDLSADETAFIQTTRDYLDLPENADINVIMWAWCNIAGHNVTGNYLPGMDSLISEYGIGGTKIGTGDGQREVPVTFIFMTGHANTNANVGELNPKSQAEVINAYCMVNGYYCLDYYSIDTHDMDDNYWEDAGDDGNSAAYGGNFYQDWQDAHVLGEHYFENRESPDGDVRFGSHNTQHITANRKGYAMWWILARIAGWDGIIPVTSISVTSADSLTEIPTGSTLQFSAEVLPKYASDKSVIWSVEHQTGQATITQDGLLTAVSEGTVNVKAMAQDSSEVADSIQITITVPDIPIDSIHIVSAGGLTEISTGASLQLTAEILPENATVKSIGWHVENLTGEANITADGLLNAVAEGIVNVIASARDGSGVTDSLQITISTPDILVDSIQIVSAGGVTEIYTGMSQQFSAEILPEDATVKSVEWQVENLTGEASISQGGLLNAVAAGVVNVIAIAMDGSGVRDTMQFTILESIILVNQIIVTTSGGVLEIDTDETLQFFAEILPENASNDAITWSVENGTGEATINQDGVLTAVSAGTVTILASAQDGSGISSPFILTINDPLTGVTEHQRIEISLYPNPGQDLFYVDPRDYQVNLIQVMGITGNISMSLVPEQGLMVIPLDLSSHQPGSYFIRIYTDHNSIVKRISLLK